MREYDKAVGRLISCCSTFSDGYGSEWSQGIQYITVVHRGHRITIIAPPTDTYFRAVNAKRLTVVEGFNITDSAPIVDLKRDTTDYIDDAQFANCEIEELTHMVESQGLEYFDGYRLSAPLFVYEGDFGAKEFDTTLSKVGQTNTTLFREALDQLGIDIDDIQAATEEEQEPEPQRERGFQ